MVTSQSAKSFQESKISDWMGTTLEYTPKEAFSDE